MSQKFCSTPGHHLPEKQALILSKNSEEYFLKKKDLIEQIIEKNERVRRIKSLKQK
jgi:hypothetical protein